MSYNVLVVGGSYFLGRIFSIFASRRGDMELTLVNRGRYPMIQYPHITEHRCDRHDEAGLERLPARDYDAVVDFCAYAPGDVSLLLRHLGNVKRYILISTADVYDRRPEETADETFPLKTAGEGGTVGEYIRNKCLLEAELEEECRRRGIPDSAVLRPAFIYGPFNYAPRESWYVQRVVRGEEIPVPADADARFHMVFVKDAAEAILACVTSGEGAGHRAYNLAGPEVLDYAAFMETLGQVSDRPFTTRPVTVAEVLRENIPLPFPLTAAESELFDGSKAARELGIGYTPFREGLEKTFISFRSVYE